MWGGGGGGGGSESHLMAEENCFGGDKSHLSWLKKIVVEEIDKSHLMAKENCFGGDKSEVS